jgi:hypothetical protein
MAVTLRPAVFKSRPVEEARGGYKQPITASKRCVAPITPFPMPLTTPPETRIYFVIAATNGKVASRWELAKDDDQDASKF